MKHLLLILFLFPYLGFTQTLRKITDKKGELLPEANVQLVRTYDCASVDANGIFTFKTDEKSENCSIVLSELVTRASLIP